MRNKLNISVLNKVEKEFGNFEIGQTFGGGNPVYLRFGYWNQVDVKKLNEILKPLNEVVEDECLHRIGPFLEHGKEGKHRKYHRDQWHQGKQRCICQ